MESCPSCSEAPLQDHRILRYPSAEGFAKVSMQVMLVLLESCNMLPDKVDHGDEDQCMPSHEVAAELRKSIFKTPKLHNLSPKSQLQRARKPELDPFPLEDRSLDMKMLKRSLPLIARSRAFRLGFTCCLVMSRSA